MNFYSAVKHGLRFGCTIDCGPEPDPEAGTKVGGTSGVTTGAARCEILPIYPPPRTADADERRVTATFYLASLLVLLLNTVKRNAQRLQR